MKYAVARLDDVPTVDLSEDDDMYPDQPMKSIDGALGTEEMHCKVWYFQPGEELGYHAHSGQEELFYILRGRFSLKLGPSGEEEYVEVGPGTFYAAGPMIGHGHRCIGDEEGVVLAFSAPVVDDEALDPHQIDPAEIESAEREADE